MFKRIWIIIEVEIILKKVLQEFKELLVQIRQILGEHQFRKNIFKTFINVIIVIINQKIFFKCKIFMVTKEDCNSQLIIWGRVGRIASHPTRSKLQLYIYHSIPPIRAEFKYVRIFCGRRKHAVI
uniref:Uncharacterized protein n=1 Tax=Meloidogyne incognita TaxID=6306 RepID=A0A914N5F6_MELIC